MKAAILSTLRLKEMALGSTYLGLSLFLLPSKRTAFAELKENVGA